MFKLTIALDKPASTQETRSPLSCDYDADGTFLGLHVYQFKPDGNGERQIVLRRDCLKVEGEWTLSPPIPTATKNGQPDSVPIETAASLCHGIRLSKDTSGTTDAGLTPESSANDDRLQEAEQPMPPIIRQALAKFLALPLLSEGLGANGFGIGRHGTINKLDHHGLNTTGYVPIQQLVAAQQATPSQSQPRPQTTIAHSQLITARLPGPERSPILTGKVGAAVKLLAAPAILMLRGAIKDKFPELADVMYQVLPDSMRASPPLLESLGYRYDNIELLLSHTNNDQNVLNLILSDALDYRDKLKSYNVKALWELAEPDATPDGLRLAHEILNAHNSKHTQHYAAAQLLMFQRAYQKQDWPLANGLITNALSVSDAVRANLLVCYYSMSGRKAQESEFYKRLLTDTFKPVANFSRPVDADIMKYAQRMAELLNTGEVCALYGQNVYLAPTTYEEPRQEDLAKSIEFGVKQLLANGTAFLSENSHRDSDLDQKVLQNICRRERHSDSRRHISLGVFVMNDQTMFAPLKNPIRIDPLRRSLDTDKKTWRPERALIASHPHLFSDLQPARPKLKLVSNSKSGFEDHLE